MKKILVIMVLFAAFTTGLTAQVLKPVKWQITQTSNATPSLKPS